LFSRPEGSLILVSGASGFIAVHLCSHLLMNGYRVRGTVRSNDKGDYLKKLFDGVGEFDYVIVEDIAKASRDKRRTCFAMLGADLYLPIVAWCF